LAPLIEHHSWFNAFALKNLQPGRLNGRQAEGFWEPVYCRMTSLPLSTPFLKLASPGANSKIFQLGHAQGGSKISTAGILGAF
jgi:hypothetical protein